MNALFTTAGALDMEQQSNHAKLMEFWEMDRLVAELEKNDNYWQDINWAVARARAKSLLRQLDLIN